MSSTGKGRFQEQIADDLKAIVEERDLHSIPEDQRNGKAFEYWCLELLGRWHENIDNDPAALPDSGDGGVDILLEDTAGRRFIVAQCAYVGKRGRFNINKWRRLCSLADDLADEERIAAGAYGTGQETQRELLRVSRLLTEQGYSVDLIYMTTATAKPEHQKTADEISRKLGSNNVRVLLWDQLRLRRTFEEAESIEAEAIDEFIFKVPREQYFSISTGDHVAHVLTLKASALAQSYERYGQRLLAWNIRSYLGANTINNEIRKTAKVHPDEFFLCNNGITAIARSVRNEGIKHTELACEKFQIINGGQTLASLSEVNASPDERHLLGKISVLVTVIETKETAPTSPFNRRIIQARNTQNKVLLSDFRSNDPIQRWLEQNLPQRSESLLPKELPNHLKRCRKIFYKPKRDSRRQKGALKLQLEDLAKIRFAYLHEPWTVMAYVNQLWTRAGEEKLKHPGKQRKGVHDAGGKYEAAFGRTDEPGREAKSWDKSDLAHCIFAVVVHEFLLAKIKTHLTALQEKEARGEILTENETSQQAYLTRARYHMVSLAGVEYRDKPESFVTKLMKNETALVQALENHWLRCLYIFKSEIDPKLELVGRDTILRGPKYWDLMVSSYRDLRALQES